MISGTAATRMLAMSGKTCRMERYRHNINLNHFNGAVALITPVLTILRPFA